MDVGIDREDNPSARTPGASCRNRLMEGAGLPSGSRDGVAAHGQVVGEGRYRKRPQPSAPGGCRGVVTAGSGPPSNPSVGTVPGCSPPRDSSRSPATAGSGSSAFADALSRRSVHTASPGLQAAVSGQRLSRPQLVFASVPLLPTILVGSIVRSYVESRSSRFTSRLYPTRCRLFGSSLILWLAVPATVAPTRRRSPAVGRQSVYRQLGVVPHLKSSRPDLARVLPWVVFTLPAPRIEGSEPDSRAAGLIPDPITDTRGGARQICWRAIRRPCRLVVPRSPRSGH